MVSSARSALDSALKNPAYVDVSDFPLVIVDLRYGSKQNILNKDVYQGFQRALLHREAAQKFHTATSLLKKRHPQFRFLVFDALRPQAAQIEFWELVKGTPQQPFFADPANGSIHSYGFALDIGLAHASGEELDMGTPFDDLTELAGPMHEERMLREGKLNQEQVENRLVLRSLMIDSGFIQLPHEWWHYDALPATEVRGRYPRCE